MSELMKEQGFGVEVEFYPVSFGEADTQTSLMISSGEQLDLVVPFGQSAFLSLINKNMLEPLDDLLDQYGDNIKEATGVVNYTEGDINMQAAFGAKLNETNTNN